jgi:hypothetical protein
VGSDVPSQLFVSPGWIGHPVAGKDKIGLAVQQLLKRVVLFFFSTIAETRHCLPFITPLKTSGEELSIRVIMKATFSHVERLDKAVSYGLVVWIRGSTRCDLPSFDIVAILVGGVSGPGKSIRDSQKVKADLRRILLPMFRSSTLAR